MDIVKGIRPMDYVLTAVMVALAVVIGLENVTAGAAADVAHPLDSHSALIVPVFIVAALPILWRRRSPVAATTVSFLVVAASVPAFGWITRCGFALPLSVAMAYAVARFSGGRPQQLAGLGAVFALQVATLVKDSSTGGLGALALSVPVAAACYGVGLLVRMRTGEHAETSTLDAEHVHA